MLFVFLLRPFVSLGVFYQYPISWAEGVLFPTLIGQLIGFFEINYWGGIIWFLHGYLSGIVLLLLLLTNLLLRFFHKQGASVSMTQELERLQQMYSSGALTEEEFTVAKKRVLGN
jgi:hypothetical protein